jgi:hypothetical protein
MTSRLAGKARHAECRAMSAVEFFSRMPCQSMTMSAPNAVPSKQYDVSPNAMIPPFVQSAEARRRAS